MPQPSGKDRKPREEPEAEFVATYVSTFYPTDRALFRVRLGAIESELPTEDLPPSDLAILGATRRWADVIVIRPTEVVLIEGALRPNLGDVSILHGYSRLVKVTPELLEFAALPLRMELIGLIYDPVVEQLCREWNIKYVIWETPAGRDYINRLAPRYRKSTKPSGFE
jgi:hypothetical protein